MLYISTWMALNFYYISVGSWLIELAIFFCRSCLIMILVLSMKDLNEWNKSKTIWWCTGNAENMFLLNIFMKKISLLLVSY